FTQPALKVNVRGNAVALQPRKASREFCRRLKLLILLRAFERSGVAFSLVSFFWRSKRKILAIGETYATRSLL
ncbi:MAG: hypothetical protein KKA56_06600, partial [Gammaproteobacteria bacterium]|nr:hypothetical protein [Gammaproteobacteria bacterium]